MNGNRCLNEKERMADLLSSEKLLAITYNTFCMEAATASLRSCLCTILADVHTMQEGIFQEMNTRGWYPLQTAEESKLQQTRQNFAQMTTV